MSQYKVRSPLIFGLILLATNFCVGAQNQTPESNDKLAESIGEKKPIRPIQNSNFYPDEDDDAGKDKCLVGEFRLIALNTPEPSERKKVAEAWIKDQAKFCTIAKLLSTVGRQPFCVYFPKPLRKNTLKDTPLASLALNSF